MQMLNRKAKSSSARRLGGEDISTHTQRFLPAGHAARLQQHSAQTNPGPGDNESLRQAGKRCAGDVRSNDAQTTAQPSAHVRHRTSSKAQALAAFQCLVQGASRARVVDDQAAGLHVGPAGKPDDTAAPDSHLLKQQHYLQLAVAPPATAAAVAAAAPQTAQTEPEGSSKHPLMLAAAANLTAAARPAMINAQQDNEGHPKNALAAPAPIAVAVAASCKPAHLVPRATKALQQLHKLLTSRTCTYLYQFDTTLTAAHSAVTALASQLQGPRPCGIAAEGLLGALLPGQPAADVVKVTLGLCTAIWEVCHLLLEHHYSAEPANTAQHTERFQEAARAAWGAYEVQQALVRAHDTAAAHADSTAGAEQPGQPSWQLTQALFECLTALAQVANDWWFTGSIAAADWCHQQLRKHLSTINKAGADDFNLNPAVRRDLQRLEFGILQGSISLAAKQEQKALLANLVSKLQQLLQTTVLPAEDVISVCLSLAGSLAEQATSKAASVATAVAVASGGIGLGGDRPHITSSSTGQGISAVDGAGSSSSIKLLEYASELLMFCNQQASALQQQQLAAAAKAGRVNDVTTQQGSDVEVTQQIFCIQQQVLLQLSQAYLTGKQWSKALDCVHTVQGLATGHSLLPGLLQVSIMALLGQGNLDTATVQLCAWLKHGGHTAEEACAAVDAFLQAIYEDANIDEAALRTLVQAVAAAAGERCKQDTSVAVAVVMQLLEMEGSAVHNESIEQLLVQLLGIEQVTQQLLKDSQRCEQCQQLLHQRGQAHYEAGNYASAVSLLTPAVFFSSSVTVGRTARLLAMSHLKRQQSQKVLDYIDLAEQQEGCSTALGCMIRLQALLQQRQQQQQTQGGSNDDGDAVVAAVQGFSKCADFDSIAMQAAFKLCNEAGHAQAAWQVLKFRRDKVQAAKDKAPRHLLQVLALMHTTYQQQQQCQEGLPQPARQSMQQQQNIQQWKGSHPASNMASHTAGSTAMLQDLCETYYLCMRHAVQDAELQLGNSKLQQQQWLVHVGLQIGTAAAHQGWSEASTQALQAMTAICNLLPAQTQQHGDLGKQADTCSSRSGSVQDAADAIAAELVTACCMTAAQVLRAYSTGNSMQSGIKLQQQQQEQSQRLEQVRQQLAIAQEQLQQLQTQAAAAQAPDSHGQKELMQSLQCLVLKLQFGLACREQHEQQMKQCLQRLVQLPAANPLDFYAAAQECLRPDTPWVNKQVATLAYGFMLRLAAAASPPNAVIVSDAVMGLMGLVSSDSVKLKVCHKVIEVLTNLQHRQQAALPVESSSTQQQPQQGTKREQVEQIHETTASQAAGSSNCYPPHNLQWLVATCWNTAVKHAAGNPMLAIQYLDAAAALTSFQGASLQQRRSKQQQVGLIGQQRFWQLHTLLTARLPLLHSRSSADAAAHSADFVAAASGGQPIHPAAGQQWQQQDEEQGVNTEIGGKQHQIEAPFQGLQGIGANQSQQQQHAGQQQVDREGNNHNSCRGKHHRVVAAEESQQQQGLQSQQDSGCQQQDKTNSIHTGRHGADSSAEPAGRADEDPVVVGTAGAGGQVLAWAAVHTGTKSMGCDGVHAAAAAAIRPTIASQAASTAPSAAASGLLTAPAAAAPAAPGTFLAVACKDHNCATDHSPRQESKVKAVAMVVHGAVAATAAITTKGAVATVTDMHIEVREQSAAAGAGRGSNAVAAATAGEAPAVVSDVHIRGEQKPVYASPGRDSNDTNAVRDTYKCTPTVPAASVHLARLQRCVTMGEGPPADGNATAAAAAEPCQEYAMMAYSPEGMTEPVQNLCKSSPRVAQPQVQQQQQAATLSQSQESAADGDAVQAARDSIEQQCARSRACLPMVGAATHCGASTAADQQQAGAADVTAADRTKAAATTSTKTAVAAVADQQSAHAAVNQGHHMHNNQPSVSLSKKLPTVPLKAVERILDEAADEIYDSADAAGQAGGTNQVLLTAEQAPAAPGSMNDAQATTVAMDVDHPDSKEQVEAALPVAEAPGTAAADFPTAESAKGPAITMAVAAGSPLKQQHRTATAQRAGSRGQQDDIQGKQGCCDGQACQQVPGTAQSLCDSKDTAAAAAAKMLGESFATVGVIAAEPAAADTVAADTAAAQTAAAAASPAGLATNPNRQQTAKWEADGQTPAAASAAVAAAAVVATVSQQQDPKAAGMMVAQQERCNIISHTAGWASPVMPTQVPVCAYSNSSQIAGMLLSAYDAGDGGAAANGCYPHASQLHLVLSADSPSS